MKKHKKQNYEHKTISGKDNVFARGAALFAQADEKLMRWMVLLILIGTPLIIDAHLSSIELGKAVWMWVLTCGCLLIWSIKLSISGKMMVSKTLINIPLLVFLFSCVLSTCFSILPYMSMIGEYKRSEGLLTLINYAALCYLSANIVREIVWIKKGAIIIVAVGVIAAVCGILQPFGIDLSRWGSGGIPISFFGNQNYVGGYMAMVIFLGMGLLLSSNTKWHIILAGIGSLLIYACLIITKNRGGFLGLLAGLIIFAILNRAEVWKKRKMVAISGLIIILTTAGLCLNEKTSPLPKLAGTIQIVKSEGKGKIEAAGTFANRIQIWKTTMGVIMDSPIFGVGPDALRMAATKHETLGFIRAEGGYNTLIDKAHNEMLDIAATRGLFGLAVYLWVLISFFILAGRLWKGGLKYPDKWLISASIAAVVSYLIQNEVGFGVVPTSVLFWVLIGSVAGIGIGAKPVSRTLSINPLVRIILPVAAIILCVILIRYSFFACKADVYYKNALALSQQQDLDQAIYMYEKALEYNPGEEFYYGEMLAVYSTLSDRSRESFDKLLKRAEDAVRINPQHAYYYNILSSTYGKAYVVYGDTSARGKAIDACNRALELKPLFGDPHNNLAAIFVYENKYKEAMDEISRAIKIYPKNAEYHRILGELQVQQGLKKEGIASLEKAVKYDSTIVSAWASLGRFYFEAGSLSKACKMMQQAVMLNPNNPKYHGDLGSIYFKQGMLDKATCEFNAALKLAPNNAYLQQMLAACHQR
ncbi:MAG: O-antigen ligase family protein [Candidatus Desantisbacteria bacterium]